MFPFNSNHFHVLVDANECSLESENVEQQRERIRLHLVKSLSAQDDNVKEFGGHYYLFTNQTTKDQVFAEVRYSRSL